MKSNSNYVRTICEVGIFAAIGYAIDELQGILSKGIFVSGGSIGFAFIAVIIIALRRGWLPAVLTGLIIGSLDLATGAYIVHPAQLFLDYVFPYAFVGLVGFFRKPFINATNKRKRIKWLIILTTLGGLFKFTSHYLAGVIFWADPSGFAWGLNSVNPFLYSGIYNMAYILPSIILTSALIVAIYLRAPKILITESASVQQVKKSFTIDQFDLRLAISEIIAGTALFIVFFIKYIQSFEFEDYGSAIDYGFDPDSMLIFVLGLMLAITGIIAIIRLNKNKYYYQLSTGSVLIISSVSIVYSIARAIRYYIKGYSTDTVRIWIAMGLLTLFMVVEIFKYQAAKAKRNGR